MLEALTFSDYLAFAAVIVATASLILSIKQHFKSQRLIRAEKLTQVLECMAIRNIKLNKLETLISQKMLSALGKSQESKIDKGELENVLESFKIIKNIKIESEEWIRDLKPLEKMDDVRLEKMLGGLKMSIQHLEKDINTQQSRLAQLTEKKDKVEHDA